MDLIFFTSTTSSLQNKSFLMVGKMEICGAVTVSTMSDLAEHECCIGLYCQACDRWEEVVPSEWLGQGLPDVEYEEIGFKCGECGSDGSKQVCPLIDGEMATVAYH